MKFSNFKSIDLTDDEIKWYWNTHVTRALDFSQIRINDKEYNFTEPADYFDLSDYAADKISMIGREEDIFSQQPSFQEFRLEIFKVPSLDTQIGQLLSNINFKRTEAYPYGLFCSYKFIDNSLYCAITVCIIDGDVTYEMPVAVMEIGQDEGCYVQPVSIEEDALNYFRFDDLIYLSRWLGNFWCGIQYEMNNRPQEVHVVEQRDYNPNAENASHSDNKRIILVKRVIPVDENGQEIKYEATNSGRTYTMPAWGVRGHTRTLADGRVIPVRPYKKGKERNKPDALSEKEYRFVEEQVDDDLKKQ